MRVANLNYSHVPEAEREALIQERINGLLYFTPVSIVIREKERARRQRARERRAALGIPNPPPAPWRPLRRLLGVAVCISEF